MNRNNINIVNRNHFSFSKIILLIILSIILIIPLIFSTQTTDQTYLIKQVGLRELSLILFVSMIILKVFSRIDLPKYLSIPFLLFMVYSGLSLGWSCNFYDGLLVFYDLAKISQFRTDICQTKNEMPDRVNFQLMRILKSVGKWDWREKVRSLDVPVLTIHGTHDSLPMEGSQTWVSSLPDARLLVVAESGHLPFVERPELFYPAVDTFLKGAWPEEAEVVEVKED